MTAAPPSQGGNLHTGAPGDRAAAHGPLVTGT
jgi:hypothetical protein